VIGRKILFCALGALLAATSISTAVRAQAPATAKVDTGELQGVAEDGVVSFKGIPFATPPVGDRLKALRPLPHLRRRRLPQSRPVRPSLGRRKTACT
jgi:hypothetical protein